MIMKRIPVDRPPLPSVPYTGGCHCGAVRYRVLAHPRAVNACHCDDCKRLSGGPFGLYLHIDKGALDIRTGQFDVFRRTGGSGNQISVVRCRACGSRMWHLPDVAPELVILCAGTLDHSAWAVPASHIYVEEATADAVAAEDALVIEGPPESRKLLWDWFSGIYR
jgi:hypothetical protein